MSNFKRPTIVTMGAIAGAQLLALATTTAPGQTSNTCLQWASEGINAAAQNLSYAVSVNDYYQTVVQQVQVQPKAPQQLSVQMDELWSFVDTKGSEQWVWLALDVVTRAIVGCYIGDRSGEAAQALWQSLPAGYRQCAVCYTDFWVSYPVARPSKQHRAVGKETGLTSDMERFNNTLRQRVSRLVRKTWSFSKKLDNHISAIWNFIHHYNEQRRHILAAQSLPISAVLS